MKSLRTLFVTVALASSSVLIGCASAKLEPADASQKVANKPNAAATTLDGQIRLQVEANSWMIDDRVKNEVTAMKVTIINRGDDALTVDYNAFVLVGSNGKEFKPVAPEEIPIRGANRSIGLPADTIITRTSDSAVNAPGRTESEKEQIREQLVSQALRSEDIPPGERQVGYVYFERVPATVTGVTFRGIVKNKKTGKPTEEASLAFQPRQYQ